MSSGPVASQPQAAVPARPVTLFPDTRWTRILAARAQPAERRRALEDLITPRWGALLVLARRKGLPQPQAEDAVQSFVVRLVEGDLLERLDPGRGRLRAYLRTAFQNHLASLHEHDVAQKRGGGERPVLFQDIEEMVASPTPDPADLFDRAWALATFEATLAELEREFGAGGRSGPFEILRELFTFGETAPYSDLAARHGMTVTQIKAFVHRAKRRFAQLLRARVADTVADPGEVDGEIQSLLEALSS